MNKRFYPLSREHFESLVLPFIEGHRKKLGRPPNVDHYVFFWNRLYHWQRLKKLCVDVVCVDGCLVPRHRHGSGL